MTNYTNVGGRALLVSLNISVWSAQRFDREVSEEVAARKSAAKSSGRYNKHLFGTTRAGRAIAPEFFAAIDAAHKMRDIHDRETLPWSRVGGERLLPTKNYFNYMELIRRAGSEFESAVATLVEAYPRLQVEAEPRLGKLYRKDDFIPAGEIKERFGYSISVNPVPSGGDVRVDLPPEQIATIEANVQAGVEKRVREAMLDAWDRLRAAVERIRRACGTTEDGHKSPVYDNLIEHAREVCSIIGRLNVAESAELEEMRQRVEQELTSIVVEDLRKDDRLRADTERRASDIMSAMEAFYGPPKQEVA